MPQLQDGHGGQILTPNMVWRWDRAKTAAEPMHGLRLIIKEDVLPLSNHPRFEALAEVSKRGLLAPENMALQSSVHQPQDHGRRASPGTVIEQNGDGCLEDSLMPVGPLHLDGAVKQRCLHRTTTLSELNELLQAYDMKRNLVELNHEAAQWRQSGLGGTWKPRKDMSWSSFGTITKSTLQGKRPTRSHDRMISTEQRVLQPGNLRPFFFRPTPDGSRQVVYQAGKTIALCKFTKLMQ